MKCLCGVLLASYICLAQSPPASQPIMASRSPQPKSWSRIWRGEPYVPMTPEERLRFLMRRVVYSPGAPVRAAILAGYDQERNYPEKWGQGADAYGRRVLNRWGRSVSRTGIETGLAAALQYEVRYIQCNCDGFGRRAMHALAMYFVTYNHEGKWVPNIPRVGSTVATQYIALSWLPQGTKTVGEATRGLPGQLAVGAAVNVWREFSPPLLKKLRKKLPIVN